MAVAVTNSNALIVPPPMPATNQAPSSVALRDIRDPVEIGGGLWWLWLILGAAVIALIVYLLKRRKRKPVIDPALLIPPHRRARERLRGANELISNPYAFCSLVSDVLRTYLEERFDLRAPDRTTEEFLEEMRRSPALNEDQKGLLRAFLLQCDLVKFARHEPAEPDLRALLDSALRLIDETQLIGPPIPQPAAPAPANAG